MEKSELLDNDAAAGGRRCCSQQSGCYVPKRYIIVALLFVGMVICHAQRVNVGVTVIAILDEASHTKVQSPESISSISNLGWTPQMVGWLHSIFYVGLLISQIPLGYLVTSFASHRLFGGCILFTCMANLLLPVGIEMIGYVFTCIIRLSQGLIEGLLYPACYDVLRIWSLPEEKSRMGATVLTGAYIGPTVGMIVSGILTDYCSWVYIFYVHGLAGMLWFCVWVFFSYANPSVHPTISADERKLIEIKQGEAALIYEHDSVPWKEIFTSLPVYALIVCNFARSFVFYMLLTNQPMYLNVFHFTIAENGLYSSLPYALMAFFCIFSGMVADYLMSKPWLSHTFVRKLFTSVGYGIEAAFFFALALIENRIMAVVFLTLGVGFSGIAISGWQINHLDLAPRYAGILVAITMTFGTLAGIFNPIIVASMTHDQTLASWHNVFWLTGSVMTFAAIIYLIFGSGDRQSWACPRPPPQRVISRGDPLASKPYGTFPAQVAYPAAMKLEPTAKTDAPQSTSGADKEPAEEADTTSFNGEPNGESGTAMRRRSDSAKQQDT